MSKNEFFKENNFTPCFDVLSKNYPHHVDRVYGKIWRYSQMRNGNCSASEKRIAKELNLVKNTVRNCLAILEKEGYIKDTTPDLEGYPHTYIVFPERLEEELLKGSSKKEQGEDQEVNQCSAESKQVVVQPLQGGCAESEHKDTNNILSEDTLQERKEDTILTVEGSSEPSTVGPDSFPSLNLDRSTSLEGLPSSEFVDKIPQGIEANGNLGVQPVHYLPRNEYEERLLEYYGKTEYENANQLKDLDKIEHSCLFRKEYYGLLYPGNGPDRFITLQQFIEDKKQFCQVY